MHSENIFLKLFLVLLCLHLTYRIRFILKTADFFYSYINFYFSFTFKSKTVRLSTLKSADFVLQIVQEPFLNRTKK